MVLRASALHFEPFSNCAAREDDDSDRSPQLWLALDSITDPQNFGALLRSAEFLGVDGVLTSSRKSAPLSPVVSKASAGAMELLTVHAVSSLGTALKDLRTRGWQVLGAEMQLDRPNDSVSYSENESSHKDTVLVLGSEGEGLRRSVKEACTGYIHVARGHHGDISSSTALVDSLNVSVAGGILMHQLVGQLKKNTNGS